MKIKIVKDLTEKILKLPVWAQEHIQLINRLRLQAEARLKCYLDEQTPTSVYTWEPAEDIKRFIQNDQVVFELSNGSTIQVWNKHDEIRVRCCGFEGLLVRPVVSNEVAIKQSKD